MAAWWQYVLSALIAYLLGSISFSYILSTTFRHEDIRTKGSGNAGTTNMLRTYGWKFGIATFVGDFLKGLLSTLIGLWIAGPIGMYIAAVFVVVGHNFSCYLHFRGGKGIAAGLGAMMVIQPIPTLIIVAVCVVIVYFTKIMSVGTLIGLAACAVVGCLISGGNPWWNGAVIIIAILGFWAHRSNIVRLMHGEENRLGKIRKS